MEINFEYCKSIIASMKRIITEYKVVDIPDPMEDLNYLEDVIVQIENNKKSSQLLEKYNSALESNNELLKKENDRLNGAIRELTSPND